MDSAMLDRLLLPFSAAFGAIVGSFLNAAIYRLPRNISLIKEKRSFCPRCRATIAWYDNIPILSWLLLLGRCRHCRGRISPRYLLVEVLTAALFAALYWHVRIHNGPGTGPAGAALLHWSCLLAYLPLVAGLVLVAFVDIQDYEETEEEKREAEERRARLAAFGRSIEQEEGPAVYGIIPDEVTITGLVLAVPLALAFPETHWDASAILGGWPRLNAVFDAAIGAVAGAGLTWGMGVFGKVFFRKAAMGLGDVKLVAMLGAVLGWKAALLVFFVAPVFGSIFGIAMLLLRGGHYVRYGPFLAAAAVLVIFYEPLAVEYFVNALREGGGGFRPLPRVPFLGPPDAGLFP